MKFEHVIPVSVTDPNLFSGIYVPVVFVRATIIAIIALMPVSVFAELVQSCRVESRYKKLGSSLV